MKRRTSGILLHMTSLPSRYGIGDLGPWAYRFADFLADARQRFWQILPLNPTSTTQGNSPYSSCSTFAGNPLLISPDLLVKDGFLAREDLNGLPPLSPERVHYKAVTEHKARLLHRVYQKNRDRVDADDEFQRFCHEHADWLEDYALFAALKTHFPRTVWSDWPSKVRDREENALRKWKARLRDPMTEEKFWQYLFFKQWTALKRYGHRKNIRIMGDLPMYAHHHSADVWSHPELFKLDEAMRLVSVSGVPPDYFSSTGQRWGNPIYRWEAHRKTGYGWWIRRMAHYRKLFDLIRLDHFMGFVHYWEIPARERTAVNGKWVQGPGEDFFNALLKKFGTLPFIAEDLGAITAEVHALRDRFKLPSTRVLQFAFGNEPPADFHKPENYVRNCVAYTGTHDNATLISWLYGGTDHSTRKPEEMRRERENAFRCLGYKGKGHREIQWKFIRLLMRSSANLVIIPMQDLLGLGEEARMNRPGRAAGNWEWRLLPRQLTPSVTTRLREMTSMHGRE